MLKIIRYAVFAIILYMFFMILLQNVLSNNIIGSFKNDFKSFESEYSLLNNLAFKLDSKEISLGGGKLSDIISPENVYIDSSKKLDELTIDIKLFNWMTEFVNNSYVSNGAVIYAVYKDLPVLIKQNNQNFINEGFNFSHESFLERCNIYDFCSFFKNNGLENRRIFFSKPYRSKYTDDRFVVTLFMPVYDRNGKVIMDVGIDTILTAFDTDNFSIEYYASFAVIKPNSNSLLEMIFGSFSRDYIFEMPNGNNLELKLTLGYFLGEYYYLIAVFVLVMYSIEKIGELRKQLRKTIHLAHRDSLTGVYSRNYVASDEFSKLISDGGALIYIDVDGLKVVNDEFGHEVGNDLIKETATYVCKNLHRKSDILVRIGGDEFIAIVPGCDQKSGEVIMSRMLNIDGEVYNHPFESISISTGMAIFSGPEDFESAKAEADKKMYQFKKKRRK
ncbi:diguanylate cyclase [Vibrio sp. SCSIO 43153]|uniref:sensor domain-containing diguanylate cyclase n=1 Tax=Vibrio sp. SCSIO 43153 TaxID=2819098 RepID=UPI0020755E1B|nr:diguanylate cyclase [Vibrio sp. SCSIO 43153]USD52565.1 diguanylate cyclase [Vibrio sp. SCSIO 43153]